MKALSIQVNGQHHCTVGLPNGGVAANVSWSHDQSGGPYFLSLMGVDPLTGQIAVWPAAELQVGDEVRVAIVDTEEVDEPELSNRSP
jgi:hypothetical protein